MNEQNEQDERKYDENVDRLLDSMVNLIDKNINTCIFFLHAADQGNNFKYACARLMLLNAGVSFRNLKHFYNPIGLHSKDAPTLSRVTFEGIVNAAYILASPPDVADRAFRHAKQKENRRHGETLELGPFRFYTENAKPPEDLYELKNEFTNKKGRERNWDENSLTKKISIVAETYGDQMYLALGSPYICWYGTSSERIHSSLYGTLRYLGRKDIQDVYSHLIIELTECISNCGVATAGMLEILGKESGLKEFSDADKTLRPR